MGGKDAVVQHEIDARARSQGGEIFEELEGLGEGEAVIKCRVISALPGGYNGAQPFVSGFHI